MPSTLGVMTPAGEAGFRGANGFGAVTVTTLIGQINGRNLNSVPAGGTGAGSYTLRSATNPINVTVDASVPATIPAYSP